MDQFLTGMLSGRAACCAKLKGIRIIAASTAPGSIRLENLENGHSEFITALSSCDRCTLMAMMMMREPQERSNSNRVFRLTVANPSSAVVSVWHR
jgi:hypothetical protein